MRLLLSRNADPHLRRMKDCLTPLQIAERLPGNNEEVVTLLRTAMADPTYYLEDGSSPSESSDVEYTRIEEYSDKEMTDVGDETNEVDKVVDE